jgi:MOSC domain-containing protein
VVDVHVSQLWRYPIKSLGAEPLGSAQLTADGIAGDRIVHVHNARGPLTGRSRHGLLTVPANTGPDGVPRVAGHPWTTVEANQIIQAHAGVDSQLAAYTGPERFDVLNLLVATDGAVRAFGHDGRRLRANVLISGVPADAEATWPGRALAIGDVLIGIHSLRGRCVVTTIDPDTGQRDVEVLRRIRHEFGGKLALNCWVIRPGTIHQGEPAQLVTTDEHPAHLGGWIVGAPYLNSPQNRTTACRHEIGVPRTITDVRRSARIRRAPTVRRSVPVSDPLRDLGVNAGCSRWCRRSDAESGGHVELHLAVGQHVLPEQRG